MNILGGLLGAIGLLLAILVLVATTVDPKLLIWAVVLVALAVICLAVAITWNRGTRTL